MKSWISEHSAYMAWAIALASLVGSVYFGDVLGIPRCLLCWWQDIFMYPLVFIIGIGILQKDKAVSLYALPLSIIGLGIAFYHNLLTWHVISESLAPCVAGVSCVDQPFVALNFITIPLLSLVAFVVITVLMLINRVANLSR